MSQASAESSSEEDLSSEDKAILDRIQSDFPLETRPWDALGEELGMDGGEILDRVKRLKEDGFIRRLAPVLSSRKVGYGAAALVAVRIDDEHIEEAADFISQYPGVTHNYERVAPRYNLWFTLHAEDEERRDEIIDEVRENTEAEEVLPLPSLNVFRIGVNFDISDDDEEDE